MFERGEIKTAVKKAEKFRKVEQKEHDYQCTVRDKAGNAVVSAEELIDETIEYRDAKKKEQGQAHDVARASAKKIVAVDNLLKKFLKDLDDVETGKKQTITA